VATGQLVAQPDEETRVNAQRLAARAGDEAACTGPALTTTDHTTRRACRPAGRVLACVRGSRDSNLYSRVS